MKENNCLFSRVIGIDVGSSISGVCVLDCGQIVIGFNCENDNLIGRIMEYTKKRDTIVLIEDIRPYDNKLSLQVIDTCKFIGELVYRLKVELSLPYRLIPRSYVKKWIFDAFTLICNDRIKKKILYRHESNIKKGKKGLINKDGEMRKPSFIWVDDRIIVACMKDYWQIPTPKPGKKSLFGLKDHSWQALALNTSFINTQSIDLMPNIQGMLF